MNMKSLLIVIAFIILVINGLIFWFRGIFNSDELLKFVWNYSLVTVPLILLWFYFDRCGWRTKFGRFVAGAIHFPPDMRGRWVGELYRKGEDDPHPFVVEVSQTMTQVHVYTFSRRSSSESLISTVSCDRMERYYKLCYLWEGESGKMENQQDHIGKFQGFTMLTLIDHPSGKCLKGTYFTNRQQPHQTMGTIELKWEGLELHHQFRKPGQKI